ncbi:hypothetical protein NKH18_45090 [Streptomyces sp. M10(2022)]
MNTPDRPAPQPHPVPDKPAAETAPRCRSPCPALQPAARGAFTGIRLRRCPQCRPLPPVLIGPGHRSTEAERTAFRTLAEAAWDRHGAAVARALARLPALRGKEQEAARADLIALRLYLHTAEGPLSQGEVTRALRAREPRILSYAACVASALNRMPSYRGLALRGAGPASGGTGTPLPGTTLRDAALVSATPPVPGGSPGEPGGCYVIWSVAGRRVRQLLSTDTGHEEVVFAPGTQFRVLDVRRETSSRTPRPNPPPMRRHSCSCVN